MIHGNTLTIDAFWVSDEFFPTEQEANSKFGGIFHHYYMGNASHLGWMDLVQLRAIIQQNNISHIILKNLDILGQIAEQTKEIQICNAYLYNGQVIVKLPKKVDFRRCHPLYNITKFGGWQFNDNSCQLPHRAQSYMECLLIHTKIETVTCYTKKVKFTVFRKPNGCPDLKTETI